MRNFRPPLRKKPNSWDYKNPEDDQIQQKQLFQLYLLAKPEELKKEFIEEVPYFWVHHQLTRNRQFEIYQNELKNQIEVWVFPYVDNMLHSIDQFSGNFKIICEVQHLQRIMQIHNENKNLLSIHIFDQGLSKVPTSKLRNRKIEIKSDDFKNFKMQLSRMKFEKNSVDIFTNATRITNADISEINKSRLVLKSLLVSKNDEKGKEDFVKLAMIVESQLGQVSEYQSRYKIKSSPEQAIKWYSTQSFYHKLVNNSLKAGKGNPLFLSYLRFPVKQLYSSIKSLYTSKNLHKQSFLCYRGGKISSAELESFKKNKGGFIQMQGFLSCSKSKSQVQIFIENCVFKIIVTNEKKEKQWDHGFCFLDTLQLTQYIKEEEVLFNIFSVMEIKDVSQQIYGTKVVDVITLEYGSLAAQLYRKKQGQPISAYQKRCINNYEALKPYFNQIQNQGDCFRFFNQFNLAEQYFIKYFENYKRLYHSNMIGSLQTLDMFNLYLNLGSIYLNLKNFDKSKHFYLQAKGLAQKSGQKLKIDSLKLSSIYNNLGLAYKGLQNISEAKFSYLKTIDLLKNKLGNQENYLSTAYNNLASLSSEQNNEKQALQYYTKALQLMNNQCSEAVANILYNIGMIYYRNDKCKQAILNIKKTLDIYTQIFGTHKDTMNAHFRLGQIYLKDKSLYQSSDHFSKCLEMAKDIFLPSSEQYINLKRDIENLKQNEQKNLTVKRTNTSVQIGKMEDLLGLMRDEEVSKILRGQGRREKAYSLNQEDRYHSINSMNNSTTHSVTNLGAFRGAMLLNEESPVKKEKDNDGINIAEWVSSNISKGTKRKIIKM